MNLRSSFSKFLRKLYFLSFVFSLSASPVYAEDEYDHKLGAQLYQLCSACHGPEGYGKRELMAPSIAGLPEWYIVNQLKKFRNGGRGAHPADISGLRMRPMARTLRKDSDLLTVAHHVSKFKPRQPKDEITDGDPVRGKTLYLTCTACHGEKSEGKKELKAPTQVYLEDWYMLEQLKKFKHGLRGANPKDVEGMTMRPIVMATLPDEQAMKDVIAYIRQTAREATKADQKATTTPTSTPAAPK